MKLLSEDDLDLAEMSNEELGAAWDLWFDLAQATNDFDPPYTHGVLVNLTSENVAPLPAEDRFPASAEEGREAGSSPRRDDPGPAAE